MGDAHFAWGLGGIRPPLCGGGGHERRKLAEDSSAARVNLYMYRLVSLIPVKCCRSGRGREDQHER